MKHSLKYYLDEGWMKICYWPVEDGAVDADMKYTRYMEKRCRVLNTNIGKSILVVDDVAYVCNHDFFEKYGTSCIDKNDAAQKLTEYMNELNHYHDIFFKEIIKQLETV